MKKYLSLVLLTLLLCIAYTLGAQADNPLFQEKVHFGRGAVQHTEWHPSGQSILVDTSTGAWIYHSFKPEDVTHIEDALLASFSPDGKWLAGINTSNHLMLWDVPAYTIAADLGGRDAHVAVLEWNPNGTEIATLDNTGTITIWDVVKRKIHVQFQMEEANQITWSHAGSYLAASDSTSGLTKAWDHDGRQALATKPRYSFAENAYSSNIIWRNDTELIRRIYSESVDGDRWDVQSGQALDRINLGYGNAYSPDGSKIANATLGKVWIDDAVTGKRMAMFDASLSQPLIAAWSPDGSKVAVGDWSFLPDSATQMVVIDTHTGERLFQGSFRSSIIGLSWCTDNNGLLVVEESSHLYVAATNTATGCLSGETQAHGEISNVAAWSSDSQIIAAGDTIYGSRLWDSQTGATLQSRMNIGPPAKQISWQPEGTLVATTSSVYDDARNNNVYIWETNPMNPDPVMVIPHIMSVVGMVWSPDGSTLATAERGRYLRLWSPKQPNIIRTIDNAPNIGYGVIILSVGWSTNSDILSIHYYAGSGYGGTVALVNAATGRIATGSGNGDPAWTPDNLLLFANWNRYWSPDSDIRLSIGYDDNQPLDPDTTKLPTLHGHQGISSVVFSPNASLLFAVYQNNSAIIWDVPSLRPLVELPDMSIRAVWSPDSTMLAAWGSDGFLKLIEPTTGKTLQVLDQHYTPNPASIFSPQAIWSPDSQKLAVLDQGAIFIYGKDV